MMQRVYIFFILIIKVHGNDKIRYPNFPSQAEFLIESIINDNEHQRLFFECIYDYNNNQLILITDQTFEYYNYTILKKSIYSKNNFKQCNIYSIDINNPFDGFSAIENSINNQTHIRLLKDFFLLTSNAKYIGENIQRGYIHVDQWLTSLSNDSDIIWSFAKSDYITAWNTQNFTIPIQRIIRRKEDGFILQILNIFNYKTEIIKKDLTPPKGIFCKDLIPKDQLLSLQDIGMIFPKKFHIRIDISTSFQEFYQSIDLYYYLTNEEKLIRYDYIPSDNTLNPVTIILDYSQNLTYLYKIDRRTGLCIINKSIEIISLTSISHNPVELLIKYEDTLLLNPPHHFFQYTGKRSCRGSILCEIYIGQMPLFPFNTEENWLATNIEWGWSKRNIITKDFLYNYPIYLNLNFYREINEAPFNIHYEFYDYYPNISLNEFDIDLCYQSNQLKSRHLLFQFKIKNYLQNKLINRLRQNLIESIHEQMRNIMLIKYLRISQLEINYHQNEIFYCIFILLDRTPFNDFNLEISLVDAQEKLENSINKGQFKFSMDDGLLIEGIPDSLQYFYLFNPNISINQIDYLDNISIDINRTIVEKIEEIHEKIQYSGKIQVIAVVSGMIIGILMGFFIVFLVIDMIKRKVNRLSTGSFTLQNISFRIKNNQKQEEQMTVTMEHPMHENEQIFS